MEEVNTFFKNFIINSKKSRHVELLKTQTGRKKLLTYIDHWKDFDNRYLIQIPHLLQNSLGIYHFLINHGASESCYIISQDPEYNEKIISLKIALDNLFQSGLSYIIISAYGKIGYYEGEDENFILALTTSHHT